MRNQFFPTRRPLGLSERQQHLLGAVVEVHALMSGGCNAAVLWSACGSTQETSSTPPQPSEPIQKPDVTSTNQAFQSSPPLPPPKRHCRSLSVPEDLSRCRITWYPSVSQIWMKRSSQSEEASTSGSAASPSPRCAPSSSFTSSSLYSSSSPTFFSLALSSDSPLPCELSRDPCDKMRVACPASSATLSSCSSSPAPQVSHSVLQRDFSLSPVHMQDASMVRTSPRPSSAVTCWCSGGMQHPALSPSPTSACSTPSSSRRGVHPALPRCHSQPCDMRRPRLKRSRDPDVLACPRPRLDFSKMTQIGNREQRACSTRSSPEQVFPNIEQCSMFSPAAFPGHASIGPLSESEEEEEEQLERKWTVMDGVHNIVFERDYTELDLNLIEENRPLCIHVSASSSSACPEFVLRHQAL
ncbi:LOW QUALITY PROTEIN: protein FAM53C-like [Brachionichthys hirsutus]|uniref:LOW QUALITY PROTEIN: protein FAM53C-like n=1 Tax=Brachionichthys hirsutus TaxID=412623 RepID=UPI0036045778